MRNQFNIFLAVVLTTILFAQSALASLLIYPVRVSFDENQRSAQVTLTNTSEVTNTYRLEWRENQAMPEGGYIAIAEEDVGDLPIASPMLRFTPRQVKLAPGERQVVKLSLRRPRDLADGEYRSHLRFKALPPEAGDESAGATQMQVNLVVNFSIPVTVQQGTYDTSVSMNKANLSYNPTTKEVSVSLDLNRTGVHSSSGDLVAYWTPKGGSEVTIAKRADYSLWSELTKGNVNLNWTREAFTPSDGTLRVVYSGTRNFDGITYFDETVEIKRADITLLE